jgi:Uma2 family endonuclease
MTTQGVAEQQWVLLEGISWETFERLLKELGDNRAARLAYDQGKLEIMSPLSPHESVTE